MIRGTGRLKGPHEVIAETADGVEEIEADAILVATGSRPRIPDWAEIDGEHVLTTRQAYPPKQIPEHLVVIGSGVTGVEFTHMFRSLGSEVTLIVSRQQVLPGRTRRWRRRWRPSSSAGVCVSTKELGPPGSSATSSVARPTCGTACRRRR